MSTKEYLFLEEGSELKYKGTDDIFNIIYKNLDDPWGQSDLDDNYYSYSRNKLTNIINDISKKKKELTILEIGCGNGFSTNNLKNNIDNLNVKITGCDISEEAIKQAKNNYSEIEFFVHNIKYNFENTKYDIVIVSNLLWYILKDLKVCLKNSFDIVEEDGHLIFLNAFLKEQRYGKNIIDGFGGMKIFMKDNFPKKKKELEINDYDMNEKDRRYFGLLLYS